MTDTLMLLVALVSFAGLIVGWMVLPDAPTAAVEGSPTAVPAVRAA